MTMANMDYINSLSKNELRMELARAIDIESALRDAFKNWPALPSRLAMKYIPGTFPDDWERGKAMQVKLPYGTIPSKTECEIGAGAWDRITEGKWADPKLRAAQEQDK